MAKSKKKAPRAKKKIKKRMPQWIKVESPGIPVLLAAIQLNNARRGQPYNLCAAIDELKERDPFLYFTSGDLWDRLKAIDLLTNRVGK